tara:strand:- start:17 stop:739 length:723 start_codon:yes stop_codon:yes gene_type:complete
MTSKLVLEQRDAVAVALYSYFGMLPDGQAATAVEMREYFSLGKTRFVRAKNILLKLGMIDAVQKYDSNGCFSGTVYVMQTASAKTTQRKAENSPPVELAQSMQRSTVNRSNDDLINDDLINVNQSKLNLKDMSTRSVENKLAAKYPDNFNFFWAIFTPTLGSKGSKSEAYREWQKLKFSDSDVAALLKISQSEYRRKLALRSSDQFDPNFPHVCRILKRRLWETWAEEARPPTSKKEIMI